MSVSPSKPSLPAGSSRRVIPTKPKWHGEVAAFSIWLLGSILARTWRLRVHDESGTFETPQQGPMIAALWHNRLALAMPVWKWCKPRRPAKGLAALISASRDGGILARTFEYFDLRPIRGSSSRRGAQALLEATSAIEDNYHIAITPDGPRGPKYIVQPGIISLAQLTGAPILPVGIYIRRKHELKSWDRFQIPLPFTVCEARLGTPLRVPREATPEEREQARLQLQNDLVRLSRD